MWWSYLSRWNGDQSSAGFLMLPYPLTNFEIQKYYQNDPGFNGVYARNDLPKVKDGRCNKSWWV